MAMPARTVKQHPLEGLQYCWHVRRLRKFDSLPDDWRKPILWFFCIWIPRKLYKWLHSPIPDPNGYWNEHNGTFPTKAEADACVREKGEGYYAQRSPVGCCHPAESVSDGDFLFSDDRITRQYRGVVMDNLSMPRKRLEKDVEGLKDSVKSLKQKASEL